MILPGLQFLPMVGEQRESWSSPIFQMIAGSFGSGANQAIGFVRPGSVLAGMPGGASFGFATGTLVPDAIVDAAITVHDEHEGSYSAIYIQSSGDYSNDMPSYILVNGQRKDIVQADFWPEMSYMIVIIDHWFVSGQTYTLQLPIHLPM